jgi:ribosomal protein L31
MGVGQALTTAVRNYVRTRRFHRIGCVAVCNAEFALATVAAGMRRSMDSDAHMAYEQSQEDNQANVAVSRFHVRFDLFTGRSSVPR